MKNEKGSIVIHTGHFGTGGTTEGDAAGDAAFRGIACVDTHSALRSSWMISCLYRRASYRA